MRGCLCAAVTLCPLALHFTSLLTLSSHPHRDGISHIQSRPLHIDRLSPASLSRSPSRLPRTACVRLHPPRILRCRTKSRRSFAGP
ncbi:hypothetical protein DFH09DRAFT_1203218 [Mycena vulgaris]|nr:hypothetical protein DFH09DRAFT_1203218 [Mycena vulgaris]